MYKIKTSYYYLERGFPENLEPAFTNQSTKRKRFLVERKKKILKRAIRKGLRTLVKPFFSAPTRKGVLIEKLESSLRDVFPPAGQTNLQKKSAGSILHVEDKDHSSIHPCKTRKLQRMEASYSREKIRSPGPTHSHISRESQQNLQKKSPSLDFSYAPTRSGEDLARRTPSCQVTSSGDALFIQDKKRRQRRCRRYKFLFPLHRLKGELSKRESQYGKIELYKRQIQERKKLAFFYGTLSKNSIRKLVKKARVFSCGKNTVANGLVALLESRLDVALFRASFFPTISMARQWISHNKVTVNQTKICAPGYQLKGGDCIEVSPRYGSLLKEEIKQRIVKILPFRRSRKKVVTPSLMENCCSFERVFYGETPPSSSQETVSAHTFYRASSNKETTSQKPLIKGDRIIANSALIENISLMKNHLQSIWEKSLYSQRSLSFSQSKKEKEKKPRLSPSLHGGELNGARRGSLSSFLRTSRESPSPISQSGSFFVKRGQQVDQGKIFDRKWQKIRAPFYKKDGHSIKMGLLLRKGVTLFGRLKKKEVAILDFLNGKKVLIQPRNRVQKLAGLQISAIKPLHLEVSYRLLIAIFLYSPQKVAYPGNLDFPLIIRSLK